MPQQEPEQFGQYTLEAELGRGGMGVVYRAYDTRRDRVVALKRLPRHLAEDATFQARFRRESRLAARLNEPHIIPIHDFGEIDGQLYIDMRLVEGVDLSNLIADEGGRLAPALAVDIVAQIGAALAAAHGSGLVHRDIKPSNILVTGMSDDDRDNPFAYLVDFGIARSMVGDAGTALTATTSTVGTVAYLAPERIGGGTGDGRSDVYALACVLYECVTGRPPYLGESFQVMFAHMNGSPEPASVIEPGVSRELDAVIRRGMAKDPQDRYQTASQFAGAARRAVASPRSAAPPPPPTPPPPAPRPPPAAPRPPPPPPADQTVRVTPAPSWSPQRPGPPVPPPTARRPTTDPARIPVQPARPSSGGGNRSLLVIAIVTVVVLAVGVGIVFLVRGGGSPQAGGSPSPSMSKPSSPDFPSDSSGPSAASTPVSAWGPTFTQFTNLIGQRPGDTATAYKGATCATAAPDPEIAGMAEQVACTKLTGTAVVFYVARFSSSTPVTAYLDALAASSKYDASFWTLDGERRGRLVTSPASAGFADVTSSICAMPTYLIQFYAPPSAGLTEAQLESTYWKNATFPDATPAVCS